MTPADEERKLADEGNGKSKNIETGKQRTHPQTLGSLVRT